MEAVVSFMTTNIIAIVGTIILILGFIALGCVFIFIWNRELYMKMKMTCILRHPAVANAF